MFRENCKHTSVITWWRLEPDALMLSAEQTQNKNKQQ